MSLRASRIGLSLVKGPENAMSAKSAKDATKGDFASLALFALVAFFGPLTKGAVTVAGSTSPRRPRPA